MLLYSVCILACLLNVAKAAQWTHTGENGVADWPALFPECAGSSQSPVNLDSQKNDDVFVYNEKLTNDLDILAGVDVPNYYVINNGHTAYVNTVEAQITVSGVGLPKTYSSVGPHFHWGSKDSRGSEHTFNGIEYPLEMHIVSYDAETYDSAGAAVASNVRGAAAVVGVMFKLSKENNAALQPIVDALEQLQHPDKDRNVSIASFPLTDLLPAESSEYFRYDGSLTTPTCNEVVTWTVMLHPQTVSEEQLAAFRKLHQKDHTYLVDNYRPVQPLNGRKVYKSFQQPSIDLPHDDESAALKSAIPGFFTTVLVVLLTKIALH